MSLQFLRKVKATFGGGFVVNPGQSTIDQMKIEFSISKGMSSKSNTASIRIYHLTNEEVDELGIVDFRYA